MLVQPSARHVYSMSEYVKAGATESNNIDEAEVILGSLSHICMQATIV